jgi:phospholipase C
MEAANRRFGKRSAGAAFHVYTPRLYRQRADLRTRAYAVEPGQRLTDTWALEGFPDSVYRLSLCGPNGFLRELSGSADDPALDIRCDYKPSGDLVLIAVNRDPKRAHTLQIAAATHTLKPGRQKSIPFRLARTHAWYDIAVKVDGFPAFARRFAGRVETGKMGFSDPVMGGIE